jgi:hypothetical protein
LFKSKLQQTLFFSGGCTDFPHFHHAFDLAFAFDAIADALPSPSLTRAAAKASVAPAAAAAAGMARRGSFDHV